MIHLSFDDLLDVYLYLTITCPDVTFSVHKLSQFVAAPRSSHLSAVHSLLRYLKSCPSQGVLLKPSTSF